ncbi:glycosyltransferase family 8 protein [Lactarius pseudohatsudake]|nr:glycosyltransferase family 8 protein [Lactarius pseudohatsudake]
MASPYAFVTLLTSDYYLPGALTLAAALRDTHPSPALPPEVDFQTVCLVTPETVDVASIKLLRKAFDVVVGVEIIEENNERGLQLLGRPDLTTVLTKLHVFRLTQYSKIIFLDADILPIRTLSHLFTLPHDFSAVPDVGWPDIFNSGLMVLSPGEDKFNELMTLSKTKGSWDGADQGLLNEWRGTNWNRLSFTYNTTPTAVYTYAPAYERFGSQISAIHFIGASKPWSSIPWRAPGSVTAQSVASQPLQVYDYGSLVDRWYAVYDRHYRSQPVIPHAAYASTRYAAAWDQGSMSAPNAFAVPAASVMSLEELRQIAIEGFSGISGVTGTSVATAGEGNYTSLPLEGRLDLMRPRPKSENGHESNANMEDQQAPDEGGRGHQSTLEDNAGSSTPKARPHLLYSGPTSPFPPDQTRSYYTGGHPTREVRGQFTAPPPTQSHSGIGQSYLPSVQVQGVLPGRSEPYGSSGYTHAQHQTFLQSGRERGPIFAHLPDQPAESNERQTPLLQQYEGLQPPQPPVSQPTQRLLRMAHEQEPRQQAYLQGQVQVSKPDLHHPQPDSGILVRHDLEHTHERSHQSAQLPQEPIRPVSPPLMTWNPAVEPPPSTAPVSSFPVTTYYPNVWDQSLQYLSDSSSSRDISSTLFAVPPPSRIPERLVQEKHYVNVLGDDKKGETPSPDRGKIKPVFPWEDKPRLTPGRVFPSTDSPPPGQFLLPAVETGSPSPSPPLRFSPTQLYASSPPPSGFPPSFSYSNAWDTVPSIQKYASRLVRPPQNVPPLAPAFDFGESRRRDSALFRNWRESEESSVDGDDEDTGDEGGAAPPSKQRSRSGSFASAPYPGGKSRKEYRSQGVQTIPKETKDQSVQVTVLTDATDANRSLKDLERRLDDVAKLSPLGSPTGLRSPRYTSPRGSSTNLAESTPRPTLYKPVQRSSALQRGGVEQRLTPASFSRTISSDTASSPSSAPPTSPADSRPIHRAGGRVWDPARGVEIFKKGSEEVLSRFLKMGSWEEKQSLSPT